jgi:hypothetical protein
VPLDPRHRVAVDAALGWYVDMCAAHDVRSRLVDGVWRAVDPMPPLHSAALVIEPTATISGVRAALAEAPHHGVADGFASLDLTELGVRQLFEATWIWRAGLAAGAVPPRGWYRVETADQLAAWNAGWDTEAVIVPAMLRRPTVAVLAAGAGARVPGGCVATLGTGAVYLSNVHARGGQGPATQDWADVVAAVATTFPGRPIVGYEQDADLAAAVAAGFEPVGRTRVWTD